MKPEGRLAEKYTDRKTGTAIINFLAALIIEDQAGLHAVGEWQVETLYYMHMIHTHSWQTMTTIIKKHNNFYADQWGYIQAHTDTEIEAEPGQEGLVVHSW